MSESESPEAVTRRWWLRTVGQTTAALTILEQVSSEAAVQTAPLGSLPQGLYDPSREHLSHAIMERSRFHPVPPGCPTDYILPPTGPFAPQFFSDSEFSVIGRITALFLDASPAEQATVEEVAQWIDLAVYSGSGIRAAEAKLLPSHKAIMEAYYGESKHSSGLTESKPDPAQAFRDGVAWLSSRDFVRLSANRQIDLLRQVESAMPHFFTLLKAEIVRGFYTSKVGMNDIQYNPNGFYARSPGCDKA
jgi:hypothetical protein